MSNKKKILFINHTSVAGGGASDDYVRMLKYLYKSGDYEISGAFPEGPRTSEFSKYCDKVYYYTGGLLPVTGGNLKFYYYFLKSIIRQSKEIKQILNQNKFDLVILNVVVLLIPAILLKKKKVKTLIIIREEVKPYFVRWMLYKFLNTVTSRIITVAQYLADNYKQITQNDNSLVLFSAVENEEIPEIDSTFKIFLGERNLEFLLNCKLKIITSIGNITQRKNQLLILKAAMRLKKLNLIEQYRFVFIGSVVDDIGYYHKVCKFINDNKLSGYCIFLGNCGKSIVYGFLKRAFANVIVSFSEGFPLTIPEAFKEGTPVITTNVGGIHDIVVDNLNGLFIDFSSSDLAEKIIKLNNDELRDKIIMNGKKTFAKSFNLEENMKKFKIYVNNSL